MRTVKMVMVASNGVKAEYRFSENEVTDFMLRIGGRDNCLFELKSVSVCDDVPTHKMVNGKIVKA